MMHFVKTNTNSGKNSLQKTIIDIVDSLDCTIIKQNCDVPRFLKAMNNTLKYLNKNNKKCKPCVMVGINGRYGIKVDGEENAFATICIYLIDGEAISSMRRMINEIKEGGEE